MAFCNKCGAQLAGGAGVCSACGAKIAAILPHGQAGMYFPKESKMPLLAGLAMLAWVILDYIPSCFSPTKGFIAFGGVLILFALLTVAPVTLFLVFTFALAKKNPHFLLLPWGLHLFFTADFPILIPLIIELFYPHYKTRYGIRENVVIASITFLLLAGAMLCYYLAISGRLKSKALPLALLIVLPVFFVLYFSVESSTPLWMIPLVHINFVLRTLPYILIVAGLKPMRENQQSPTYKEADPP